MSNFWGAYQNSDLSVAEQLRQAEERFGLKNRRIELDSDWYGDSALPMLVGTTDGRVLAVLPDPVGGCSYIEGGVTTKITRANMGMFKKEAVCFYKTLDNGSVSERGLAAFMIGCTSVKDRVMVLAASALTIFAGMILPWANSFIFANVIPEGNVFGMLPAAALILSAVIIAALMKLVQSLSLTNAMLRVGAYVQSAVFARLLSIKPEFFKSEKPGKLSQLITEFSDISRIVSVRSISACIGIILSFLYLLQVWLYAPALFGWVILITVILILMIVLEGAVSTRWQSRYSASLSEMSGFAYELFSGMEKVKLNGAESRMLRRWSEKYRDTTICSDKPLFLKYSSAIYKLLTIVSTAMIFLLGKNMSASNYIAFSAAYGAYISAISGSASIIGAIGMFRSSYALIKNVMTAECEEYGAKERPEKLNGEIDISNVYFRYEKDQPYVLNGLSAHIKSGESIGIVGPSGCGKSTLIRLLLGFETADEGSVYIDGFDIRELDLKGYRRKVGTVLQDCGLIAGDIRANITMTKPDASLNEITAAIEAAGLAEDIDALPMGLSTPVNPENNTFSGGQRQRMLIARALISKPSILILDEATSALDGVTQAKIIENVNKLECTKIIVAHRLSTIEKCDRILVLNNGVIEDEGTYDELLNRDGLFKNLAKRQIPV